MKAVSYLDSGELLHQLDEIFYSESRAAGDILSE